MRLKKNLKSRLYDTLNTIRTFLVNDDDDDELWKINYILLTLTHSEFSYFELNQNNKRNPKDYFLNMICIITFHLLC